MFSKKQLESKRWKGLPHKRELPDCGIPIFHCAVLQSQGTITAVAFIAVPYMNMLKLYNSASRASHIGHNCLHTHFHGLWTI